MYAVIPCENFSFLIRGPTKKLLIIDHRLNGNILNKCPTSEGN